MYAEYYQLTGLPFQLTPDFRFYFGSSVHSKAMAHLTYGLSQGEGFIIITGEVGAGKTTLVEHLCAELDPQRYVAARIATTQTSADDTLRLVATGFGLNVSGLDKASTLSRLEQALAQNYQAGRRSLLIVDEAQNLSIPAIEELRMLSNFVIGNRPALQSFLLGQPQFRNLIAAPELDQLRQRVLASYHLGPLSEEETRAYIEHRLKTVGWTGRPQFTDDAFDEIYAYTGGVPRKINTLCSRLMLFGFLEERDTLSGPNVRDVASDLERELGLVVATPSEAASAPIDLAAAPIDQALETRLRRIEQQVEKQERILARAMEIAARYAEAAL